MKTINYVAEEAYLLGKLVGYKEGAQYWKREGASAERAVIVKLAEKYRLLALGFSDCDYSEGYRKALAVLIAAIERGDHARPAPRDAGEDG